MLQAVCRPTAELPLWCKINFSGARGSYYEWREGVADLGLKLRSDLVVHEAAGLVCSFHAARHVEEDYGREPVDRRAPVVAAHAVHQTPAVEERRRQRPDRGVAPVLPS